MVTGEHRRRIHRHRPPTPERLPDHSQGWSPRSQNVTMRPFPGGAEEIVFADPVSDGEVAPDALPFVTRHWREVLPDE
jgi:hypothetical protein